MTAGARVPAAVRLAAPSACTRRLDALAGDWDVDMTIWPSPGGDPVDAQGVVSTRSWELDGRYLEERLAGVSLGAPYHRIGYWGYNALAARYELVTCDTLNPGFMIYGAPDTTSATLSYGGAFVEAGFGDAVSGKHVAVRFDVEIVDRDRHNCAMYYRYPAAREFLVGRYVYTRRRP